MKRILRTSSFRVKSTFSGYLRYVRWKEEVRDAIKKAGMLLDDDELEAVSGGERIMDTFVLYDSICALNDGGRHDWITAKGIFICTKCGSTCTVKKPG